MEIEFPIEFIVSGTPVSQNPARRKNYHDWQAQIRAASSAVMPSPHFATEAKLSVVLYYLPVEVMRGDLDNIIKPILDALKQHLFVDDHQVERLLVQKFEPEQTPDLAERASAMLKSAWDLPRPLLYIRISDTIDQEIV